MKERRETAAGGVVCRRGEAGLEVALGAQRDRLTGAPTVRLPKGRPSGGESAEATAVREVEEETGLAVRVLAPLGSVAYAFRDGDEQVAKEVHFFLMEAVGGDFAGADGELEQLDWFPIDEALGRVTYPTEREALSRARERARQLCA